MRLFIPFYIDKNPSRREEILYCARKNLMAGFDLITFVCETKEEADFIWNEADRYDAEFGIPAKTIVKTEVTNKRQTFNHMLELMETHEDVNLNVFCNSDIFFLNLKEISDFFYARPKNPKFCLALSRYDLNSNMQPFLFERADSQDTWVFEGHPKFKPSLEIKFGVAGNDNRFAHETLSAGFEVLNPSKRIKTYHLHLTDIRNYVVGGQVIERIPPPYHLVTPF